MCALADKQLTMSSGGKASYLCRDRGFYEARIKSAYRLNPYCGSRQFIYMHYFDLCVLGWSYDSMDIDGEMIYCIPDIHRVQQVQNRGTILIKETQDAIFNCK